MRGVVDVAGARKAAAVAERAAVVAAREASKRRAAPRLAAAGVRSARCPGAGVQRETLRVVLGVRTGSMGTATAVGRLGPLEMTVPTLSGDAQRPAAAHRTVMAARAAADEQTSADRHRPVPADDTVFEEACRSVGAAAAQPAAAARLAADRCETVSLPVAAAGAACHEAAAARAACRAARSPSGRPVGVARADAPCQTRVHPAASGHSPAGTRARPTAVQVDKTARRQLITAADRRAAVAARAAADRAAAAAHRCVSLGERPTTGPRWPPLRQPSGDVPPVAPAVMAPRVPSAVDRRAAVAAMANADRRAAVARRRAASNTGRQTKKGRPWKWPLVGVRPSVAGAASLLSERGSHARGSAPTLSLLAAFLTLSAVVAAAVAATVSVAAVSAVSTVSLLGASVALVPAILPPHLPVCHFRGLIRSLKSGSLPESAPLVSDGWPGGSVNALGTWCCCGRRCAPKDRRRHAGTVDAHPRSMAPI